MGPLRPAVSSTGNLFLTTGNGSSTTVTQYDYGDSVLDFTPSLTLSSFFAPGPPQQWSLLNANDEDLASIGASLLSGGLIFAIGIGGRGYLLSQAVARISALRSAIRLLVPPSAVWRCLGLQYLCRVPTVSSQSALTRRQPFIQRGTQPPHPVH